MAVGQIILGQLGFQDDTNVQTRILETIKADVNGDGLQDQVRLSMSDDPDNKAGNRYLYNVQEITLNTSANKLTAQRGVFSQVKIGNTLFQVGNPYLGIPGTTIADIRAQITKGSYVETKYVSLEWYVTYSNPQNTTMNLSTQVYITPLLINPSIVDQKEISNFIWIYSHTATPDNALLDRAFQATLLMKNDPAREDRMVAIYFAALKAGVFTKAEAIFEDISTVIKMEDNLDKKMSELNYWAVATWQERFTMPSTEQNKTKIKIANEKTNLVVQKLLVALSECDDSSAFIDYIEKYSIDYKILNNTSPDEDLTVTQKMLLDKFIETIKNHSSLAPDQKYEILSKLQNQIAFAENENLQDSYISLSLYLMDPLVH